MAECRLPKPELVLARQSLRDRMTEEQVRMEAVVLRQEELDTHREGATETKDKRKQAA